MGSILCLRPLAVSVRVLSGRCFMNGVLDYGGNYDTIMNVITALGKAGGVN